MSKITKVFIAILAVLVVGLGAVLYTTYATYGDIKKDPKSVFIPESLTNEKDGNSKKEIVNILLLGIDSNSKREKNNKGYRSDSIIICSINMFTNKVTMLSIPRDTKVDMNKLDYDTGQISSRTTNKITSAYAFGGGPKHFGAKNSMDTVSEFLSCGGLYDVPIKYYVSIDMDGFGEISQAVDGVDVTLDMNLPGLGSKDETVTLKGGKALEYVRERYDVGGDYARARRQQMFMAGFAKKIKSMGAINTATSLYDEFMRYGQTNLTLEEIIALAALLEDVDLDDIEYEQFKGQSQRIEGLGSCEIMDMESVKQIVEKIFYQNLDQTVSSDMENDINK